MEGIQTAQYRCEVRKSSRLMQDSLITEKKGIFGGRELICGMEGRKSLMWKIFSY